MRLNEEQTTALEAVSAQVETLETIHRKHERALLVDLGPERAKFLRMVRTAVEAGVPKRQVQRAAGISSTQTFYDMLREAGVEIEEKPAALKKIQFGSPMPRMAKKFDPTFGGE